MVNGSNVENDLFSKQEMELFLLLPGLWAKNYFYNILSILTKEFKIDFQNRKWNYSNRKRNFFCHFQASDQKTSVTTLSPYLPRNSKWILKTGNGIIQIRNGIISPTSKPLIKKLLLQNVSNLYQKVQNRKKNYPIWDSFTIPLLFEDILTPCLQTGSHHVYTMFIDLFSKWLQT